MTNPGIRLVSVSVPTRVLATDTGSRQDVIQETTNGTKDEGTRNPVPAVRNQREIRGQATSQTIDQYLKNDKIEEQCPPGCCVQEQKG